MVVTWDQGETGILEPARVVVSIRSLLGILTGRGRLGGLYVSRIPLEPALNIAWSFLLNDLD